MSKSVTEIHLVDNLEKAFRLAYDMQPEGVIQDLEGTIFPYIGNEPKQGEEVAILQANLLHAKTQIELHDTVAHSIATNNENNYFEKMRCGIVEWSAGFLCLQKGQVIPYAHKGMLLEDGSVMGKKPSGEQSIHLVNIMQTKPENTILIDDQGVKNAGEAVRAGLGAIIVPNPIGLLDANGRVIEHTWVQRFRKIEPAVYRSLAKKGNLAGLAYKMLAGIELSQISFFDHRAA